MLTGEGYEPVAAASVAMHAQKSVGENSALQKAPELSFDEARRWATAVAGPGEKRLELLRDNLVQDSFVCPAGSVRARGDASGRNGGVEGPRG